MTPTNTTLRPAQRNRSGFTLVEVMISIALVLMIIYGVAKVFKLSTDAVGANQAVAAMVRDNRAAHATLTEDFRNCVADSPLFLISSRLAFEGTGTAAKFITYDGVSTAPGLKAAYSGVEDERADSDGNPRTIDLNGNQVPVLLAALPDRIPRLDRLGFFARGLYRRTTTADTTASEKATSGEAFIWYGHTVYPLLHGVTNLQPNNQYASERILGRMCYLLKDKTFGPSSSTSYYSAAVQSAGTADNFLSPLSYDAQMPPLSPGLTLIGRYDLALVTLDQWRLTANNAYNNAFTPQNAFAGPLTWYQQLETIPARTTAGKPTDRIFRPICDPNVTRPITPKKLSSAAPYFVGNCTQFVVEYAGDFLNQDPADGLATDVSQWVDTGGVLHYGKTDGQIDYIIDKPSATDKKTWSRRIRWYGLPRDTTGPDPDGVTRINEYDVVPLRDAVYATFKNPFPAANFIRAPWETEYPGSPLYSATGTVVPGTNAGGLALYNKAPGGTVVAGGDYTNIDSQLGITGLDTANKSAQFRYVNAWHNDAPLLIRVTFKVSDPSNRIQNGQWYEYVLSR